MSENSGERLNILFLGASYGSLPAAKMLMAGHNVHFVCRQQEVDLINADGFRVRITTRQDGEIEIDSRRLPGRATAKTPSTLTFANFDLVCLAMAEPQYSSPEIRELLRNIGKSGVPCVSIMNMPPPPYLRRVPNLDVDGLAGAYTDIGIWRDFTTGQITLCSPDPQAIRPPGESPNVLQVTLATNFKVAKFGSPTADAILYRLQSDFEAARQLIRDRDVPIPVQFKVFDSAFVPFSKWPMLIAGNCRCVTRTGSRTIAEAVNNDVDESRSVFDFVQSICLRIGAHAADLVPFEKYLAASRSLTRASSSARALDAGAIAIERADKLVQLLGGSLGVNHPVVDNVVAVIDFAARTEPQIRIGKMIGASRLIRNFSHLSQEQYPKVSIGLSSHCFRCAAR
ncbi:ketopantoate reductase family protein [Hyphomicrobium sp.]|uniref:ketopantoate reductase family protein n=1 Tax=Hyphomicrobium sp. TaxID=82 RepID=UPI0039E51F29